MPEDKLVQTILRPLRGSKDFRLLLVTLGLPRKVPPLSTVSTWQSRQQAVNVQHGWVPRLLVPGTSSVKIIQALVVFHRSRLLLVRCGMPWKVPPLSTVSTWHSRQQAVSVQHGWVPKVLVPEDKFSQNYPSVGCVSQVQAAVGQMRHALEGSSPVHRLHLPAKD